MGATNPTPENLPPITYRETRVITTDLLAAVYGTEAIRIQQNFSYQMERFTEGKHFFRLDGDNLRAFKNQLGNSELVGKRTSHLILWTERGAARHAKMLDTDQAWEVFEKLEDAYFRQALAPAQDRALVKVREHLRRVSTSRQTATRLEALVERMEGFFPPDAPPLIPMPFQGLQMREIAGDAMEPMLRGHRDYALVRSVDRFEGEGIYFLFNGYGEEMYRADSLSSVGYRLWRDNKLYGKPFDLPKPEFNRMVRAKIVFACTKQDDWWRAGRVA